MQLHHISIIVADVERSLAFYSGLLGIDLLPHRPDLGYPGAWLDLGLQQIHLLQVPDPDAGVPRPDHGGRDRHFALAVEDLDAIQQRFDAAGVAYTLSRSGRRAVFCRDPDRNAVEIIQVV